MSEVTYSLKALLKNLPPTLSLEETFNEIQAQINVITHTHQEINRALNEQNYRLLKKCDAYEACLKAHGLSLPETKPDNTLPLL